MYAVIKAGGKQHKVKAGDVLEVEYMHGEGDGDTVTFHPVLVVDDDGKTHYGKEAQLAVDKSRSQVFDISPLGLLEVTRKRVSGGLLEAFSETCPQCEGRGVLITYDVN